MKTRSNLLLAYFLFATCLVVAQQNTTNTGTDSGEQGNNNSFFGVHAGENAVQNNNSFFGAYSGRNTTVGKNNVAIGMNAGRENLGGSNNVFIGMNTGRLNVDGNNNLFGGAGAGRDKVSGNLNTFLGAYSGRLNLSGNRNTFLGANAGRESTGNRNVFLGYRAGFSETGNQKLYIENSDIATPLIYGDFDTDFVTVHGKLGIGVKDPSESLEVQGNAMVDGIVNSDGVFIDSSEGFSANWGLLGAGRDYGNDRRSFCVAVSHDTYADELVSIKLTDNDTVGRYATTIRPNSQFMDFKDRYRNEIFKFSHAQEDGKEITFLHMPKAASRFVLGGFGLYRAEEGHNLVVKDGSAMIEDAIYTEGHIGIGTTDTQGYELAVAGKIITEGVKVRLQGDWPDYVFEDTYTLPSLQEVATHIEQNGHLINIPSAKEVKENGIFLGEMNAKLLEKIEELTLYTIQQEKKLKKMDALEAKNRALEARLAKIEALLNK